MWCVRFIPLHRGRLRAPLHGWCRVGRWSKLWVGAVAALHSCGDNLYVKGIVLPAEGVICEVGAFLGPRRDASMRLFFVTRLASCFFVARPPPPPTQPLKEAGVLSHLDGPDATDVDIIGFEKQFWRLSLALRWCVFAATVWRSGCRCRCLAQRRCSCCRLPGCCLRPGLPARLRRSRARRT